MFMERKRIYFVLLALAIGLAILAACGSGEVVDITSPEYNVEGGALYNAKDDNSMNHLITGCKEGGIYAGKEGCPNLDEPLPPEPEPSSDSQNGEVSSDSSGKGSSDSGNDLSSDSSGKGSSDSNNDLSSDSGNDTSSDSSNGDSSSSGGSSSSVGKDSSSSNLSSSSEESSSDSGGSSDSGEVSSSSEGGESGCAYDPSWCGSKSEYETAANVPGLPTENNAKNSMINGSGKCFFTTTISSITATNGRPTINGVQVTGNTNNNNGFTCTSNCESLLGTKKDGGYYVYNSGNGIDNNGLTAAENSRPNCLD
jgi:hypothetical protein